MTSNDQRGPDVVDKETTEIVRDLAEASPPKSMETIKAAGDVAAGAISHERLRRRAYEMWEAGGRPAGDGSDYWLKAEQEARTKKEG